MPDPSIIAAALQSHSAALAGAVSLHSANAARCKVWGAGIVAGMLLLSAGKPQMAVLPWVAGVVGLLAVADACCVALARQAVEAYNRFMARVPLNGGNLAKAEEWLVLPGPDLGIREAGSVLRALGSFSVWPFHAGLLALVVAIYLNSAPPAGSASGAKSSGANKPLPATHVLSAPTPRPGQTGGSAPVGTQSGPRMMQLGQPGQPPTFSPLKPAQPQPGARPLALPPRPQQPGTPQNGIPAKPPTQTGAPQNTVPPQNGIPPQSAAPVPARGTGGTPVLPPALVAPSPPGPADTLSTK